MRQKWDLLLEYHEQLTQLEMIRAYPIAQLLAFVGNALGGKSDSKGKKSDSSKMFTPLEMLSPFAMTKEIQNSMKYGGTEFSPAQCHLITDAIEQMAIPSWVAGMINQIQPIEMVVGGAKPHLVKRSRG